MAKAVQYSCSLTPVTLEPGQERVITAEVKCPFRAERIMMVGEMDEVRGHFLVRRSRLPPLNRENVIAYSNVTLVPARRRTTVEYRCDRTGNFIRHYQPSSVQYVHVEPLSYVMLRQLWTDREPAMSWVGEGVSADYFGIAAFGNGLPLPTTQGTIALSLMNKGDIPVTVWSAVFGTAWVSE